MLAAHLDAEFFRYGGGSLGGGEEARKLLHDEGLDLLGELGHGRFFVPAGSPF
jgi:hypothetical protein